MRTAQWAPILVSPVFLPALSVRPAKPSLSSGKRVAIIVTLENTKVFPASRLVLIARRASTLRLRPLFSCARTARSAKCSPPLARRDASCVASAPHKTPSVKFHARAVPSALTLLLAACRVVFRAQLASMWLVRPRPLASTAPPGDTRYRVINSCFVN